ncbi:MAG: hypothetical protein JWN70_298, partial [Planctomycetaceae bacterium]|nr:hypothetical protein [Planctomycetaceae bacterium]
LLSMLEMLEHIDLNRLKELATAIPYINSA